MHKVTKQYRTETGHRLNNYDGKCSHLHGHSYLWEVTTQSTFLNPTGMVLDFKDLKKAMIAVLEPLDHAMVLASDDPLVAGKDPLEVATLFKATNGKEPRMLIWHGNPTAESFANWAAVEIQKLLPVDATVIKVRVWETATSYAEWESHL